MVKGDIGDLSSSRNIRTPHGDAGKGFAVEEQGAATQEIARNVEQAASGTQEVTSNIGGVSQAANDTGAAATQIRDASSALSEQSERLRTEVDKFLEQVRAAQG